MDLLEFVDVHTKWATETANTLEKLGFVVEDHEIGDKWGGLTFFHPTHEVVVSVFRIPPTTDFKVIAMFFTGMDDTEIDSGEPVMYSDIGSFIFDFNNRT